MPQQDTLLTYVDIAAQLQMSLRTVKQLVYDGQLAAVRLSPRNIRVRQSDLDAYINRHAEASIYNGPVGGCRPEAIPWRLPLSMTVESHAGGLATQHERRLQPPRPHQAGSRDDLLAVALRRREQAAELENVAAWFEKVAGLLAENEAETVGDLPDDVLTSLASRAPGCSMNTLQLPDGQSSPVTHTGNAAGTHSPASHPPNGTHPPIAGRTQLPGSQSATDTHNACATGSKP